MMTYHPPGYDDASKHDMTKVTEAEHQNLLDNGWVRSTSIPYLDLHYTYKGRPYRMHLTPADALRFEDSTNQTDPDMVRLRKGPRPT